MTDYNIVNLPIDNGLKNEEISSGRNYLILLSAPTGANVKVRINGVTADAIPLYENFAIDCKNVKTIHVSCDAVANGVITIGQSNSADDFKILTAPAVRELQEVGQINNFSAALLAELDKVINPYDIDNSTFITADSANSVTTISIFNQILDCDKVIIFIGTASPSSSYNSTITAYFNGTPLHRDKSLADNTYGWQKNSNRTIEIENVRGKTLHLTGTYYGNAIIQKINKKV